jgi:hypothetical protein
MSANAGISDINGSDIKLKLFISYYIEFICYNKFYNEF